MSLLNIDTRFAGLSYEISALGRYLEMLEQQLKTLVKKEHLEAEERFNELRKHFDEAEWQIAHQELDELVQELIPRFFRCPFIVMLWAIYESGIKEVSKSIQTKKGIALSINDIKAENFLRRAQKYFDHILKFVLFTNNEVQKRLDMLRILRNSIAHGNGRIEAIKNKRDVEKIKSWEKTEIGISTLYGNIIFSERFLRETYLITSDSLNHLITRTKESLS